MEPAPLSDRAIEPLFASNERLWLRIWVAIQVSAIFVAGYALTQDGSAGPFLAGSIAVPAMVISVLVMAYTVVGVAAHGWMMRRPLTVFVFIPLGWAVLLKALSISGAFAVLILGAILQAFIFLPFAWGIGTLAVVILLLSASVASRGAMYGAPLTVARVVGILAIGTTFGTVMLYIHRANRDAAARSRLLRQLDEAQRDLAARAKDAGALEERQRLARDIHDTIAQGFTSVIKHLETVELSFGSANGTVEDMVQRAIPHLAHAQIVSRESLAELRRLLWALRPPQLVETALGAAIERFVAHWSEINGIKAECVVAELPPLRPEADVLFLRAAQESLSNVARHAHATRVSVSLHSVDGLVLLSVEDDGRGFDNPEADVPDKMGIAGMRERVRPFGGRVLVESSIGEGTSLTVAVPIAEVSVAAT